MSTQVSLIIFILTCSFSKIIADDVATVSFIKDEKDEGQLNDYQMKIEELISKEVVNKEEFIILGQGTNSTQMVVGNWKCNGTDVKGVHRFISYPSTVPCTGISFILGNDAYNMTLYDGRFERAQLGPTTTISAYLNGYQVLTQSGVIVSGTCSGSHFVTNQMLSPVHRKGCSAPYGLQRTESYYAIVKIHGGKCEADCFGKIAIDYEPPVRSNYVY